MATDLWVGKAIFRRQTASQETCLCFDGHCSSVTAITLGGSLMEQTKNTQATLPLTFQQRIAATLAAALLGTFLVYGVGLANSDTMHNAAHDGRHAFAFPCH